MCPVSFAVGLTRSDITSPVAACLFPSGATTPVSAAAPAATIASTVSTAFKSVAIPKPTLGIQPPGGETLVNIETVLAATAEPFSHTVTLLGQQVTLDITPTQFVWSHGDGTTQRTPTGGRPLTPAEADSGRIPEEAITHVYASKGTAAVSVAVIWSATWRLGKGAAQPVPGTVTTQSPVQNLTILEAHPQLTVH